MKLMDNLGSRAASLLELTCVSIRSETHDIKTFSFEADREISFEAGQALTLMLEIEGELLYRTFSISSRPSSRIVDITMKAHPNGRATSWLHRNLKEGDLIKTRPPSGRFTIGLKTSEKIALVSAGSGATPLFSMLQHLSEIEPDANVAWVHAARTPVDLLFTERLTSLQGVMPNLSVASVVTNAAPGWHGYKGLLGRRMMSVVIPDFAERQTFSCGPAGFMHEIKLIFAAEGGNGSLFHTESFGMQSATADQIEVAPDVSKKPVKSIRVADRLLESRGNETLLQACLRQGVIIPCGCGQGMCGTCMIKKISGEVEMQHQDGITPEEEAAGYILACCSRLVSDVEIAI